MRELEARGKVLSSLIGADTGLQLFGLAERGELSWVDIERRFSDEPLMRLLSSNRMIGGLRVSETARYKPIYGWLLPPSASRTLFLRFATVLAAFDIEPGVNEKGMVESEIRFVEGIVR